MNCYQIEPTLKTENYNPMRDRKSLTEIIASTGAQNYNVMLALCIQIADSLLQAHRKGLIHRDLKPDNIMIDEDGCVSILNFKEAGSSTNETMVGAIKPSLVGTPAYMSPGVASGQEENTRCDIYSFGAIMYEMLTGHPPFHEVDNATVIHCLINGPPPMIRIINPKAHKEMTAVSECCMQRWTRFRYASIEDVLRDLKLLKAGKPPLGIQVEKSSVRWKRWLGLTALIIITIAGICIDF